MHASGDSQPSWTSCQPPGTDEGIDIGDGFKADGDATAYPVIGVSRALVGSRLRGLMWELP